MHELLVIVLRKPAKAVLLLCLFVAAALAALPASAQEGATCGVIVTPDGGLQDWGPCPKPGMQPGPPPVYKWAAIAISKANLQTFTAWHGQTREAAERTALNLCAAHVHDCKIAVSGPQCVAFAVSPKNGAYGLGTADNYLGADKVAISRCGGYGGVNCVVTADPCSDDGPVNQQYTSMAK